MSLHSALLLPTLARPTPILLVLLAATRLLWAGEPTVVEVRPDTTRQEFQGMGCGAIYYEAHITSLGANGHPAAQEQLYDDMFAKVRTDNEMARRYPAVPRPQLVAPNTLSAVRAADTVLPALLAAASDHVDVAGSHDYDRRGDRWARLRRVAGPRPVWVTEARSMLTVCLQPATGR